MRTKYNYLWWFFWYLRQLWVSINRVAAGIWPNLEIHFKNNISAQPWTCTANMYILPKTCIYLQKWMYMFGVHVKHVTNMYKFPECTFLDMFDASKHVQQLYMFNMYIKHVHHLICTCLNMYIFVVVHVCDMFRE